MPARASCVNALFVFVCLILVIGIDAWSKSAIFSYFTYAHPGEEISVFSNFLGGIHFSLIYTPNYGAAWGLFANWHNALIAVRILSITGLFAYMLWGPTNRLTFFALSFMIAGAIGNVIDSFIYGHVVDMFLFTFWGYPFAVFNVADAAISIGVGLLCINAIKEVRGNSSPCRSD